MVEAEKRQNSALKLITPLARPIEYFWAFLARLVHAKGWHAKKTG
jgi:hypothetical protein